MKKCVFSVIASFISASAFASSEAAPNIIDELMGAVDTTTIIAAVSALGLVAVGVSFGMKGITFVKRLVGKM